MKRISIVVTAGIGLLVAARVASAQTAVERGAKAYEAQNCSRCHSIGGKGNPKGSLDGVGAKLSADEIRRWIVSPAEMTASTNAKRKPVMKAYPSLSKGDVDALVAYMASLKTK